MEQNIKMKNMALRLLIIAFAEGATVMACELIGAKMTAPFFGTSLYSWASVLAVTLGGLALGYYVGGILTTRYRAVRLLFYILLISGLFLFAMPWIASITMASLKTLPLTSGLLLSMTIFLLPPIILFGMVSPVIIHLLVTDLKNTGKTAGRVYGVSTVGGVINTLLLGFWIIPEFGLKGPAMLYGLIMVLLAFLLLPINKKAISGAISIILMLTMFSAQTRSESAKQRELFQVRHASEGLLGQVKVVDYSNKMEGFGILPLRGLLVNNTWQTVIHRQDGTGMLDYTYFLNPLLSRFGEGKEALLIGLGGGTVPTMIHNYGADLTVVELDPRLPKLSRKYFGMPREIEVVVDDGRHFLQEEDRAYDLIVFDAFLGENPPWHLLTVETFEQVKEMLNDQGLFLIEFYGFLEGENGLAARSLFASLESTGFKVKVIMTGSEPGINSNFIFVCATADFDLEGLDYSQMKYTDKTINDLNDYLIDNDRFRGDEHYILSDNLPILDKLLMRPAREWRSSMNGHFRDMFLEDGKPVFY